jgi:misacylated tRNA(Ala) deacylase
MTKRLYEKDTYLKACEATVMRVDGDRVVLDQTVFYAMGGGQPGDSGVLTRGDGSAVTVIDTRKGEGDEIDHIVAPDASPPKVGETVEARIDWQRRHRHMRMHTALHLLCSLVDAPVSGGNLGEDRGRLDFDLPEPTVDKQSLTQALNQLVDKDLPTAIEWITDDELDAQPELVRTMSVAPPRGDGAVRLLRIAEVDLQPCGGTHVASTGEIGRVRVAKIEKKSKHNRRVALVFDE